MQNQGEPSRNARDQPFEIIRPVFLFPVDTLSATHLAPPAPGPYIDPVGGNPDYGDKRPCNNRLGPGGGTRRLHQTFPSLGRVGPK